MSKTLKELLEGKTLPIRVNGDGWGQNEFFEVRYEHDGRFYGHDDQGRAFTFGWADRSFKIIEPPKPKKLGYVNKYSKVVFLSETPFSADVFERAPWLDEK